MKGKTCLLEYLLMLGAGISVHNLRLAEAALQQASCGTFDLSKLFFAYIEVQLPSWRRPLRIHMRGIKAELRQRQMPQVSVVPQGTCGLRQLYYAWLLLHCLQDMLQETQQECALCGDSAIAVSQHVDLEDQRLAEQQAERKLRAEKLALVDNLLWNTSFMRQNSNQPENTGKSTPALYSCCPLIAIICSHSATPCPLYY